MATVPAQAKPKKAHASKPDYRTAGQARRSRVRMITGVIGLLALLYFLPTIIGWTPLRDRLLNMAIDEEQGEIDSGGASLGWFSPLVIRDLQLYDAQGQPLLSAESVTCSKSLVALIQTRQSLGTVEIAQPKVHLKLRSDGSNLEDFIAPYLEPADEPAAPIGVTIEIIEGTLAVDDLPAKRKWELRNLAGTLKLDPDEEFATSLSTRGNIVSDLGTGPVDVELKLPGESLAAEKPVDSEVHVRTQSVPIQLFSTVLHRFAPETTLAGRLDSDLALTWDSSGKSDRLAASGDVRATEFVFATPELGPDRIRLSSLHVPCDVARRNGSVDVKKLEIESELGMLQAEGNFRLAAFSDSDLLGALTRENFRVGGRIDLARLAALLPSTLHVREGTTITDGQLEVALVSETQQDPSGEAFQHWQGRLEIDSLAAMADGQQLTWQEPVEVNLNARSLGGLTLDPLECKSDFLTLRATGDLEKLSGKMQFDLDRLMAQLSQIVDLQGWEIAGQGDGEFQVRRTSTKQVVATAAMHINNFILAGGEQPPWREEKLTVEVSGGSKLEDNQLAGLLGGSLRVSAQEDFLEVRWMPPDPQNDVADRWPVVVSGYGQLAQWIRRARPLVVLPVEGLDGLCELNAEGTYAADRIAVTTANINIRDFKFTGYGMNVSEPQVKIEARGEWDVDKQSLLLRDSALVSPAIMARTEALKVSLPGEQPLTADGKIFIDGYTGRIRGWLEDPNDPWTTRLGAHVVGDLDLSQNGAVTTARLDLTGTDIVLKQLLADDRGRVGWVETWNETEMKLKAGAIYDGGKDSLAIGQANLVSTRASAQASGSIQRVLTQCVLDVSGTVDYDLAKLMPLLRVYTGRGVQFAGREQGQFSIKGPLFAVAPDGRPPLHWSQRLAGTANFGWKQGDVYGIPVGAARVDGQLRDGNLVVRPIDVALSQGRLTVQPWAKFHPEPAEFYIAKGEVLRNVQLTPEMCNSALKYVAPILAEATNTQGQVSLNLDGARIPMGTPQQADLAGTLVVNKLEVMPGPLAREYILLGKQIEALANRRRPPLELQGTQPALLLVNQQQIPFRLVEGRVYHQGMAVATAGTVIRTSGSVGLDETLDLVAEVPISDRWLGNDPAAKALSGTTIRVPIRGTFSRPRIDGRVLDQLGKQMLRSAAQGAINEGLNRALDGFFGPPK